MAIITQYSKKRTNKTSHSAHLHNNKPQNQKVPNPEIHKNSKIS